MINDLISVTFSWAKISIVTKDIGNLAVKVSKRTVIHRGHIATKPEPTYESRSMTKDIRLATFP